MSSPSSSAASLHAASAAWERQLAIQAARHQDEVYRLQKTIEALKDAVRRRDHIIRQMLDESCALAELPLASSSGSDIQMQNPAALQQPLLADTDAPSSVTITSTNIKQKSDDAASPGSSCHTDVSSFVGSAEVEQQDQQSLDKLPIILERLLNIPSIQPPREAERQPWCRWAGEKEEFLLQPRRPVDVVSPRTGKLRRPAPKLLRGVSKYSDGTWRAVFRLRSGPDCVVARSGHLREHPVHAALDADAMERRFIPSPAQRRVNFAQEAGEWQVFGRRAPGSRILAAQLVGGVPLEQAKPAGKQAADGQQPAAKQATDDQKPATKQATDDQKPVAKQAAAAPASAPAANSSSRKHVSAATWRQQEELAERIGMETVLERQPSVQDLEPQQSLKTVSTPKETKQALSFNTWLEPGVVHSKEGEVLVTRTPRPREAIPHENTVTIAQGRLYVGVLATPASDSWILHVVGSSAGQLRCARDVRLHGVTALAVALLSDTVQRNIFKNPSDRRVNFAEQPGEWQLIPQKQCSHNARQQFLQYKPDAQSFVPKGHKPTPKDSPARDEKKAAPKQQPSSSPKPAASGGNAGDLSDEEVLAMFPAPSGVHLPSVEPPVPNAQDVLKESAWQPWLNVVSDSSKRLYTTTARGLADVQGTGLYSAKYDARQFTGVRVGASKARMYIAITMKARRITGVRQREYAGHALAAALMHDRVQRLLLRKPTQRRVNFATQAGEWQFVLQKNKPANSRPLFVQFMPAGLPPDAKSSVESLKPAEGSSRPGGGSRASKKPRTDAAQDASQTAVPDTLQRPPAALASAVRSSDAPLAQAAAGGDDDSAYKAWLEEIASRVTTDIVLPGEQEKAVAQYLSVATSASPRPLPASGKARAALHHLVNGVERRLYRCIRSSPTVSGQFALRGQLASLVNEQTFDTPFAAALAADEAVRRSVALEEHRLVNFKQPGSKELQYLPCSRNLRVSVYAAAPELASPNGAMASSAGRSFGGNKRGRTQ